MAKFQRFWGCPGQKGQKGRFFLTRRFERSRGSRIMGVTPVEIGGIAPFCGRLLTSSSRPRVGIIMPVGSNKPIFQKFWRGLTKSAHESHKNEHCPFLEYVWGRCPHTPRGDNIPSTRIYTDGHLASETPIYQYGPVYV